MSTATINENTFRQEIRPKYTLEQRTVKKNRNQSVFIPLNQLPEEVIIGVKADRIEFILSYSISEETDEKTLGDGISVKLGVNTARIFSVIANFEKHNFNAMVKRFSDVEECFNQLKKEAPREILRKNYDLILAMTQMSRKEIINNQEKIKEAFSKTSTSDNLSFK